MSENRAKRGSLTLPPGIEEEQLIRAVHASGYPLQTIVILVLSENFNVTEEWGYVDRASQEHRSLDVFAHRRINVKSSRLEPALVLLIECKRSELPYVFFAAAIPRIPAEFPSIVGFKTQRFELHKSGGGFREVSAAEFLNCSEFAFIKNAPAVASTFCRAERKGKDLELSGMVPYNSVVLPLASALEYHRDIWKDMRGQECYYPQIAMCVCVIDAPIVLASGTPDSPVLRNERWVRLVRQEAVRERTSWRPKQYVVDAVQREFLPEYVSHHLIPFADELAARMIQGEGMLIAARAAVPDWGNWAWSDIRPA